MPATWTGSSRWRAGSGMIRYWRWASPSWGSTKKLVTSVFQITVPRSARVLLSPNSAISEAPVSSSRFVWQAI